MPPPSVGTYIESSSLNTAAAAAGPPHENADDKYVGNVVKGPVNLSTVLQVYAERNPRVLDTDPYYYPKTPNVVDRVLAPWQFDFLVYAPGFVTTASLANPVLTGPMSGCCLCKYTEAGQQYIAHVGTEDIPTSAGTIRTKQGWANYVEGIEYGVSNVSGDYPAAYFPDTYVNSIEASLGGLVSSRLTQKLPTFGYFEGGISYAMLFLPANDGTTKDGTTNATIDVKLWRLCALVHMKMPTWLEIASKFIVPQEVRNAMRGGNQLKPGMLLLPPRLRKTSYAVPL